MSVCSGARRAGGFTLIELMVTIVVATILITIAVPTYQSQVRKSRRTEARIAVMDLAAREERYYSVNNDYTNSSLQLGYLANGQPDAAINDMSIGSGYYHVTVLNNPAAPPARATFTITAKAVGTQIADKACQQFTVDDTGAQTSLPNTTDCWS